jgi:phosphoglycolate phosphatase-like HAD superfamily hydrolase
MDSLGENLGSTSGIEKRKWISVPSELEGLDGQKKDIKIELMEDGKPRAVAFFDIDGTLAHLGNIHGMAIRRLFNNVRDGDLEETYYNGFKLGNSFREFDRMREIYVDGHVEWKDPEIYLKERFAPHAGEIDEPGNPAHDVAAAILKEYGKIAAQVAEDLYKVNPKEFAKSNIEPMFKLARMYSRLGIPMVGFTANAKSFVDKLAKYLKLSDIFLDIATDETMVGGGKEVAIHGLMRKMESKGLSVPKDKLIFVGDSIRGDIGTGLAAKLKDKEIVGQGVLVLRDKAELLEMKRKISQDPALRHLADSMEINALVLADVPLDEHGNPMLFSRFRHQFLERL